MFTKSGIIKQDPELPPDKLLNLPAPRPKNAIFEDEEKSKVSASLFLKRIISRLKRCGSKCDLSQFLVHCTSFMIKPRPLNSGCLLHQMLSRLLNSSHPEDLKAANKLIKEMVQEVNLFSSPSSSYKSSLSVTHEFYYGLVCYKKTSEIPVKAALRAETLAE